jgi:hypothetical protein
MGTNGSKDVKSTSTSTKTKYIGSGLVGVPPLAVTTADLARTNHSWPS